MIGRSWKEILHLAHSVQSLRSDTLSMEAKVPDLQYTRSPYFGRSLDCWEKMIPKV
jgi:hypothetical protein